MSERDDSVPERAYASINTKQRNSREGLSNLSGKSEKNERSTDYLVRSLGKILGYINKNG